jgi:Squalene-hopene cyclase C-terminal domain
MAEPAPSRNIKSMPSNWRLLEPDPGSRKHAIKIKMTSPESASQRKSILTSAARALSEATGLLRAPQRAIPLFSRLASDQLRTTVSHRHLYSYASTTVPTENALRSLIEWILQAQKADGGIAAYYSLLTGYSNSYPEVTGYIIPTLYDFARNPESATGTQTAGEINSSAEKAREAADRATHWLYSLQLPTGAFPGGLHGQAVKPSPSIFNTGQILQGLVRAHIETGSAESLKRAVAVGDWLAAIQLPDGSWSGEAAYQGTPHTYYSMVSWALAQLAAVTRNPQHSAAADKNIDWVLEQVKPSGWFDGINLRSHPTYLHFVAYVIQGTLESGILHQRTDAVQAAAKAAWVLLRKFETHKRLAGTYEPDFTSGQQFACLTGNAQMSCIWLRLFEITGDPRYLNAALKMNELLKQTLPSKGRRPRAIEGVIGGVAGSSPIWGAYQPMRFISWGNKFMADALMLEQRLTRQFEKKFEQELPARPEASECA